MHICSILYYLKNLKTVCVSVANHSCSICILVNVSTIDLLNSNVKIWGHICLRMNRQRAILE